MDWKLFDIDGKFLQEVNCEYDSCDISRWEYSAKEIKLDFVKKEAHIIAKSIRSTDQS